MVRRCRWLVLLLVVLGALSVHAQQFDVIAIGPQGQTWNQEQQGQWSQQRNPFHLQPDAGLLRHDKQRPEPRRRPEAQDTERLQRPLRERPALQPSAFERYVAERLRRSADNEARIKSAAFPAGPHSADGAQPYTGDVERRDGRRGSAPPTDQEGPEATLEDKTDVSCSQFGYELFSRPPSTFAPVDQVPVGPDYVIGPDDEIRIAVWGKVEGRWTCAVDRDGNIDVPKIGILGVTGLTFRELKELLGREFSKYFTGYDMSVSMGSLRTMKVYVVGNASRPGAYTVSSLATLVNALIEAGGPSKTGTMRDIQVKRKGMTPVHFDMYDLLLSGDKTGDVRLMPEDVIFIPPVGPLAAIIGNVRTPAIYELKNETTLSDLIRMAGGLTGFAFKGRIQLQRTQQQEARTVFEGDLVEIEKTPEKNILLRDWDIARVFDVAERNNVVRITGAVANGGEFGIVPNVTTIKDVIAKTGGLLYYASTSAEVTRVKVTQEGPVTERFTVDLASALAGDPQSNVVLDMNDYIFVRSVPEWQLYRTVTVSGQVRHPGTYTIKKGERLSSLLERAGGYTDRAYLRGAVFTRERVRELQQKNLETMIVRMERELLAEGASVRSASAEGVEARKIELQQKQAFIESLKRTRATGRLTIRLANLRLLQGSAFDIELEDNDSLTIPMNNRVVSVVGAVMSNTTMVHLDKVSAKEYVRMAGGYSRYADAKNSYVLSVDGSARRLSNGTIGWSDSGERWEMAGFQSDRKDIEAGDTIVVPEKLDRVAWLREIKDITQILANVAVAAGAVYLFSK